METSASFEARYAPSSYPTAVWQHGNECDFLGSSAVRSLRCQLLREHLDKDTADLDDGTPPRLYRTIARENRRRAEQRHFDWQGLAFALTPSS